MTYTDEEFVLHYEAVFGHEPDLFALKKWKKQSDGRKQNVWNALSSVKKERDKESLLNEHRMMIHTGEIAKVTSSQLCEKLHLSQLEENE